MKTFIWLTTSATLGLAAYVLFSGNRSALSTISGDLSSTARSWGSEQRLGGQIKEGFGDLTGNNQLAGEGVADQAIGGIKDAAGKAANAVSNAADKL